MKCPECGLWNRASMPHCIRCGAPLNIDGASRPAWKDSLKDGAPGTKYLRADEFGQMDVTPDPRDALAREMQELKVRKQEGAALKERILRPRGAKPGVVIESETARVPSAEEPREHRGWAGSGRRAQEANQGNTIVLRRVSPDAAAEAREKEARRRIRFMDDTGVFVEPRTYDPLGPAPLSASSPSWSPEIGGKSPGKHTVLRAFLVFLLMGALGIGGYFTWEHFFGTTARMEEDSGAVVTASLLDGLAAHTIMIPGKDGTTIYIRELHASYLVTDGFATVEVADHIWYDNLEGTLDETMDVTLTPFLKASAGKQTPLSPITYPITIPLSPITLESPDSLRSTVSTTMATIKIVVRPGSRVTVNGINVSDTVSSETGEMSYNATVQPIGNNPFEIVVRSPYCRDNTITVVLYRAPQEIPLDLSVGTYGTTDNKIMKVTATTLPGAYVEVTTPHSDLDITYLDTTGKFSFNAIFDKIGDNTISISSSYPGKKTSVVEHTVYYLPPADEYTVKAWPLTAAGYSELLSNIAVRAERAQVYVVTGVVQYSLSDKPQRVVINTSEDGKSQPVVVQNYTKTHWEVGTYYRIYADAYSTYNSMPWLNGRYTYRK